PQVRSRWTHVRVRDYDFCDGPRNPIQATLGSFLTCSAENLHADTDAEARLTAIDDLTTQRSLKAASPKLPNRRVIRPYAGQNDSFDCRQIVGLADQTGLDTQLPIHVLDRV